MRFAGRMIMIVCMVGMETTSCSVERVMMIYQGEWKGKDRIF